MIKLKVNDNKILNDEESTLLCFEIRSSARQVVILDERWLESHYRNPNSWLDRNGQNVLTFLNIKLSRIARLSIYLGYCFSKRKLNKSKQSLEIKRFGISNVIFRKSEHSCVEYDVVTYIFGINVRAISKTESTQKYQQ